MIFIPIISIIYYYLINGSSPYEGFTLFKAYILISLSLILYITKCNLLSILSKLLNLLSFIIVLVLLLITIVPDLQIPITYFGEKYGILLLGDRQYNVDVTLKSIYFVTSPMLCISISYYTHLAIKKVGKERLKYSIITFINCLAMFVAGTRNNMLFSIVLPLFLIYFYSNRKVLIGAFLILFVFIFIGIYQYEINVMLSPEEESNGTKLQLLQDYRTIFNDPLNLYFGQGLGSYYNWSVRGSYFISELTYLDILRNFGLVLGIPILLLLLFPFFYGINLVGYNEKYLIWAYFFYLIMSISNPLFFSSLGMLILSIIMANLFIFKSKLSN
jgi:hypothetical protein